METFGRFYSFSAVVIIVSARRDDQNRERHSAPGPQNSLSLFHRRLGRVLDVEKGDVDYNDTNVYLLSHA